MFYFNLNDKKWNELNGNSKDVKGICLLYVSGGGLCFVENKKKKKGEAINDLSKSFLISDRVERIKPKKIIGVNSLRGDPKERKTCFFNSTFYFVFFRSFSF